MPLDVSSSLWDEATQVASEYPRPWHESEESDPDELPHVEYPVDDNVPLWLCLVCHSSRWNSTVGGYRCAKCGATDFFDANTQPKKMPCMSHARIEPHALLTRQCHPLMLRLVQDLQVRGCLRHASRLSLRHQPTTQALTQRR